MKIKHILLPTSLFILSSCVTLIDYPPTWPSSINELGQQCELIAGTYLNRGETQDGQTTYLSDWLFDTNIEFREFQYLSLAFDENNQMVVNGSTTSMPAPIQLPIFENNECRNNYLSINLQSFENSVNAVSLGSSKRHLYKTDNHLIIESSEGGVGVVLLIPVVAYANNWARFSMLQQK